MVDEYGNVQGVVSMTDVLEAIVGDIPNIDELGEQEIRKRDDGSFLVDGLVPIDEFEEYFHLNKMPGEKSGNYHTVGGFIMYRLNRIPLVGDSLAQDLLRFEILDMDGHRIDKKVDSGRKGKTYRQ